MKKIRKFEYIFADCPSLNNCFFDATESFPDDCEDTCVVWNDINFYGIPFGTTDSEFERLEDGNFSDAIKIGEIIGCLILCNEIIKEGLDPVEICDDVNQDLEYTLSAMSDNEGPFCMEDYQDVYYIHDFQMEKGYNNDELKSRIITELANVILRLFHVKPGFLAFYPLPLEYIPNPNEEARYDILQKMAAQKVDMALGFEKQDEKLLPFANAYQFSDDELNIIMRRRVSGSSYPKEAKNKKEFDFYISNGFKEVGDSRLLCKEV